MTDLQEQTDNRSLRGKNMVNILLKYRNGDSNNFYPVKKSLLRFWSENINLTKFESAVCLFHSLANKAIKILIRRVSTQAIKRRKENWLRFEMRKRERKRERARDRERERGEREKEKERERDILTDYRERWMTCKGELYIKQLTTHMTLAKILNTTQTLFTGDVTVTRNRM